MIKRWNAGSGHCYSIDKKRVIGVTTALKALPKELTGWAARTVADYVIEHPDLVMRMLDEGGSGPTRDYLSGLPFQRRNDAAIRGTAVHNLAEQIMHGHEVEVPEDIEGYVESYIAFCNDWNPAPVLSETVVASRAHMYAGTFDSIQDVPTLGRVLVDYKTSNGIYGEVALQTAAYRFAEVYLDAEGVEQPMMAVDSCYVLHIQRDGYELVPLDAGRDTFETFLSVLTVYRRAIQQVNRVKRLDTLIGEPLAAPVRAVAA